MNENNIKSVLGIYSPDEHAYQEERYSELIRNYRKHFYDKEISFFSSPGRTELGGNHTDHNHGKVLAAAVNLDTIAAASPNMSSTVTVYSEGYPELSIDISDTEKKDSEEGTTEALVRGIAAGFKKRGLKTGGFNAAVSSNVPPGSGLSSSASIEMLITYIFSTFYNENSVSIIECARISRFAENVYFNKPSGLMDQTACGYGGIISIDFRNEGNEIIDPINFSFNDHGYILTVIKTDSSHADLTYEYSSITEEMGKVSSFFGKSVLREVDEEEFFHNIPELRKKAGGRAVIRAIHFFNENRKVDIMKEALKKECISKYLETAAASGDSSFKYLQNVYSSRVPEDQATSIALSLTENFLSKLRADAEHSSKIINDNKIITEGSNENFSGNTALDTSDRQQTTAIGACRIHGGGFAGTVQAYIPSEYFDDYKKYIESVFGKDTVVPLKIRNTAGGFTGSIIY